MQNMQAARTNFRNLDTAAAELEYAGFKKKFAYTS